MAEEKMMTEIEWRRMCGETGIEEKRMTEKEWRWQEEREIEEERMVERPKFEARKIEAKNYERKSYLKGGYESIMIERKVVNYFSFKRVAELLIADELGDIIDLTGESDPQRAAEERAKGFAKEMAGDMDWSLGIQTPRHPYPIEEMMERNWMRAQLDYM